MEMKKKVAGLWGTKRSLKL